jgi:hypothetical protein
LGVAMHCIAVYTKQNILLFTDILNSRMNRFYVHLLKT